jgi:hypothetical protein
VPGAAKYDVLLATDPALGSLIGSGPIETSALSLAPPITLHVGTYYWAVTPIDAEGNRGVRSAVRSFRWAWPAVPTNPQVEDLVDQGSIDATDFGSSPESSLYLPQFRWSPVPGATRYELEINSDRSWAAGSRVCCDEKILSPVFAPTQAFLSNRYYWRVRAFDASGNPGAWTPSGSGTDAQSFVKTFDNVCNQELPDNCIPAGSTSIRNLHVEDWSGTNVTGGATSSPLVIWDPVPGASSYDYEVTRFVGGACDFTWSGTDHWRGSTAVAAWSPLGTNPGIQPYPDNTSVSSDIHALGKPGAQYCVRIRAESDHDGQNNGVFGDYTTLANAFTYSGRQSGVVPSLSAGDYLTPAQGQSLRRMPFFRWRPVFGAQSYWVLIAKDPSFTNIIDYAYTEVPVYAPRTWSGTTTYPDETTTYYWVVLPAGANGGGASGDPVSAPHGTFQKQVPPANLEVSLVQAKPVFRWKPVAGSRHYELQVSTDPNFGTTVETATTASTSYTAAVTYPAGKKLYWRVRADDDKNIGLSWATSSFNYRLPAPSPLGNPRVGDTIPTWRWNPVPGAVSYDLHADLPDGSHRDFTGLGTAAFTATEMTGTGIFHWQVRANFPSSFGTTYGPYSRRIPFAHTIPAPTGVRTIGGGRSLVFAWAPRAGAKQYQVQISSRPDFGSTAETATTDVPVFASTLASYAYGSGGTFYWRVAVVDGDGNSGDYSPTRRFHIPRSR